MGSLYRYFPFSELDEDAESSYKSGESIGDFLERKYVGIS